VKVRLNQSIGFVELFASLAGAGVLTWIVWRLAEEPMAASRRNAQLESVQRSLQWTDQLLFFLPVLFLLTAVVGSIAWAVFQTRSV